MPTFAFAQFVKPTRSSNAIARCLRTGRFTFASAAIELQRLPAGQVRREAEVFGQVADAGQGLFVSDRPAENRPLGPIRPDDGHHDLDQGALAGAVGAQQPEDLAGSDLHLNAAERFHAAAIRLGDVAKINGKIGHENSSVTFEQLLPLLDSPPMAMGGRY